jgi:hypothetical protein
VYWVLYCGLAAQPDGNSHGFTISEPRMYLCSSSYDYLREHFRSEHFLCEEGGCAEEKFTSVFRTEIDLKGEYSEF